nr:MAG TPA: hypothetical protein [Inoviridae sp.]
MLSSRKVLLYFSIVNFKCNIYFTLWQLIFSSYESSQKDGCSVSCAGGAQMM